MTRETAEIADAAARWHLASERDDMDWDGFAAWLEADPDHRRLYNEAVLADDVAARHAGDLAAAREPAAESDPDRRPRWPIWAGGAMAAAIAAVVIVPQVSEQTPITYVAGRTARTIALKDGSQVVLAPASRLVMDNSSAQNFTLEGGALFDIRHDPGRVMTIHAGSVEVADIGTRFEIQATPDAVRVEVANGAVRVGGDALDAPVRVPAGRRFTFDRQRARAVTSPISPGDVGEWRHGRLTFDDAPLTLVAEDLQRYASANMLLTPALAQRRFSGTLSIDDGDAAIRDVAQIMGARVVGDGAGMRLVP